MKFLIAAALFLMTASTPAFAHDPHEHQGHLVFQNGALHAHATWVVGPQESEESILRLDWKNGATHQPTNSPGTVKVVLWMPDMGHGSSPTRNEDVLDQSGNVIASSVYIRDIYFVMGGRWQVKVSLTLADGSTEEQVLEVNLAGHGGHHH